MDTLTVETYLDRLDAEIRAEFDLSRRFDLVLTLQHASDRLVANSKRRLAYEAKVKRVRSVVIAERLGVTEQTVNRYIREWCETYRLPIPRMGISDGDEILVTSPHREGREAARASR